MPVERVAGVHTGRSGEDIEAEVERGVLTLSLIHI